MSMIYGSTTHTANLFLLIPALVQLCWRCVSTEQTPLIVKSQKSAGHPHVNQHCNCLSLTQQQQVLTSDYPLIWFALPWYLVFAYLTSAQRVHSLRWQLSSDFNCAISAPLTYSKPYITPWPWRLPTFPVPPLSFSFLK